jgi:hypothetical protein
MITLDRAEQRRRIHGNTCLFGEFSLQAIEEALTSQHVTSRDRSATSCHINQNDLFT